MITTPFVATYVLLWLLVLAVIAVVLMLGRQLALIIDAAPAESEDGPALGDALASQIAELDIVHPVVIAALSPSCGACRSLMPELALFAAITKTHVAIISRGSPEALVELQRLFPLTARTHFDIDGSLLQRLGVKTTPFVMFTDQQGVVRAKGSPRNASALFALALQTLPFSSSPEESLVAPRSPSLTEVEAAVLSPGRTTTLAERGLAEGFGPERAVLASWLGDPSGTVAHGGLASVGPGRLSGRPAEGPVK